VFGADLADLADLGLPADVAFVGGAEHSSSDNKPLLADRQYGHKVYPGQKLLQFAFWDNF
jgi:hypothetical protein